MKFKLNDYIIEYEVIRKDNKNLYFRINENCQLVITAKNKKFDYQKFGCYFKNV